jgi:hypothetical protein
VLRILQPDFTRLRVPRESDKAGLLRAIDRSRSVLGLVSRTRTDLPECCGT